MKTALMAEVKTPRKLIEVALPLDAVNAAAKREKSIRHGHPSTLHLWWARRPLAAARAVLFAQMVNDPGYQRASGFGVNRKEAEIRREQLFDIIRDLVRWENTNDETVLKRAREAIRESWRETCHLNRDHPRAAELFNPEQLPAFHDPFAGGGAIPLEAQRLGLESLASDLNPVAVMINKAMIEIPPRFAGQKPVGPLAPGTKQPDMMVKWSGARGLAEDVRRYGHWMREAASKRIGHLYPKVRVTGEMAAERPDLKSWAGRELTVIAYCWARTVKSPNPVFAGVDVPLVSTFMLSTRQGKEAYVEPVVKDGGYRFAVKMGKPQDVARSKRGTKLARGANFECLLSRTAIPGQYIKDESRAGRMGSELMAIVAEGDRGRVYLSPTQEQAAIAAAAKASWVPDQKMNRETQNLVSGRGYGFFTWADLFTPRQLVALTTFSDLVPAAREKAIVDAKAAGIPDDSVGIDAGGTGATAYGEAVSVYLAFVLDKVADYWSSICSWHSSGEKIRNTFGRQAIPMVWDYAEANPFCSSTGNWLGMVDWVRKALASTPGKKGGLALQQDAATQSISIDKVISIDPPYYDNICYADLSDFFYVWMRRPLKTIYPGLFSTIAVPKAEELVATPYRHGSREQAENFFMEGITRAIRNLAAQAHPAFPVTIYYAFKQSETKEGNTTSTGWETFLEAVIRSGFSIVGTWPMRTELTNRLVGMGTNALASSIVLVCRKRKTQAESISRRQFQRELREIMPGALQTMVGGQGGRTPVAPVDLSQAAIGPGMAVFSKYAAVIDASGNEMRVHDALVLINRAITEYLNPDSGNFDADTLFCADWFNQYGWSPGQFGEANVLAQAKGTSVDGVDRAGVIESGGGKVRLLKWRDYPTGWDPQTDHRVPAWEACHHMIRALNQDGESGAGALLARMPDQGEQIRQLAYHLYTLCERKNRAEDARAYNELIVSWHAIVAVSHEAGHIGEQLRTV